MPKLTQVLQFIFSFTYLFCPPHDHSKRVLSYFQEHAAHLFISSTSLLRVEIQIQMFAEHNWSSVVMKLFPTSPGLCAAELAAHAQLRPGGGDWPPPGWAVGMPAHLLLQLATRKPNP